MDKGDKLLKPEPPAASLNSSAFLVSHVDNETTKKTTVWKLRYAPVPNASLGNTTNTTGHENHEEIKTI